MSNTGFLRRTSGGHRAALVLAVLVLAACSRPPDDPVVLSGPTMGTIWTVQLAEIPEGVSVPVLRADIEALLEQVNAEMSTWREDSVITRFNRAGPGEEIEIPEGFAHVLVKALRIAADTGGAFDPTVGPLVNLWGFGPDSAGEELPHAIAIAEAMERVGYQRIQFDHQSRILVQPGGAWLDLSAIAKGWGADVVVDYLGAQGISGFLVDLGGDLVTRGQRADGRPWRIAIERPLPGTRDIQQVIEPGDAAVATSGSYRQFIEADGRRYSHTIDPRTGYPVDHQVVSVTVIAENCTLADALATALGVLPPDQAMAFATERDLAVLWLLEEEGEIVERHTPAFAPLLDGAR